MTEKIIYVIAGCNGAGKTTASYTILPEILDCKIFVNADEIAKGLSPFDVESVAFESGRIMLERIDNLISENKSFSIETTLSSKSYKNIFANAINKGYTIKLLFFWLHNESLAIKRVKTRVKEGGHNITEIVIKRRYQRGIDNLFKIYLPLLSEIMIFDNSNDTIELVATGNFGIQNITNYNKWKKIQKKVS
ncbi:zeta toxin family protein [Flavobacterium sp.]|jgi:predicted ABC-type ATPase|uniref:zeta toxin family protein n=1 Tax=Flavobacterium sp. TaxID=239 RepID=UPI0037BFDA89